MVALERKLLNRQAYRTLAESGFIAPNERVELLNGEIIQMSPVGPSHGWSTRRVTEIFYASIRPKEAIILVQDPIALSSYSEPEPDVAIVAYREDEYFDALPTPVDVYLLVEISDTTLVRDREIKAKLYAEANIPEFWIINISEQQLECYSEPKDGTYQQVTILNPGTTVVIPHVEKPIQVERFFRL